MSGGKGRWSLPLANGLPSFRRQPANRALAINGSANGHIPSDLLSEIFTYLQLPARYTYGVLSPWDQPAGDLRSVLLVCRAWYASGLEFLYRNPCIASARSIRSLKDTLMANPRLATLIRSIIIPALSRSRSDRFFHPWILSLDNNLSSIMNACTHLHSVSISYHHSDTFPLRQRSHVVLHLPNLTGIRRLCLSGDPSSTPRSLSFDPDSSLPLLEELHIGHMHD
ncbi:hypothetical protein JAAARDRAFT_634893 [Jaapia argillacea MUCL 33604]|uniref:Uncharacterized protein n=1 Tax=Jaapia argillacea MUCL 33604 TaxID=933084 RepID=A0A067PYT1_9AGAM|nr:hypothetical protein JAAARDRAFT_634893 [Jaapia argillacea MUCL 33604]